MRFSIIVPVYQVENYIRTCLESMEKQTYQDFEVILVDDGSKDSSSNICEEFVKKDKRFRLFHKENGGLSDARNYGVKKAKGEYLLFVDSDDSIEDGLLEVLDHTITKNNAPELIRFQVYLHEANGVKKCKGVTFSNLNGEEAFQKLIESYYLEPACCYAYQRKFWLREKFEYAKGRYHEDFGLTPYVILKAQSVSSIAYYGYHYMIRENSITTSKDKEKTRKRLWDVLALYDSLKERVERDKEITESTKKFFYSFLANSLLARGKTVDQENFNDYEKELKQRNIADDLLSDNLKRKIKKRFVKHAMTFYIKHF